MLITLTNNARIGCRYNSLKFNFRDIQIQNLMTLQKELNSLTMKFEKCLLRLSVLTSRTNARSCTQKLHLIRPSKKNQTNNFSPPRKMCPFALRLVPRSVLLPCPFSSSFLFWISWLVFLRHLDVIK